MTDPSSTNGDSVDTREQFIPVRKADLVQNLLNDPSLNDDTRGQLTQLCRLLEATIHYHFHSDLESLKNAYAHFNPDADTLLIGEVTQSQREEQAKQLFDEFEQLLQNANFRHLSREEIQEAMDTAGHWGFKLDVDFHVFDRLEVFARGVTTQTYLRRSWSRLFRLEKTESDVYQRMVMIFQLKQHNRLPKDVSDQTVYIKIFKNIPQRDVQALLPGTRVKMPLFDQVKVVFPTLSGVIVSIVKLFIAAAALTTFALLGLIAGTIGYGVKSFFGFLRTKEKHQLNLTKNLYYLNLDNNAGVLFRLLDDAEEQEFREAILAYFLLWREKPVDGWSAEQLDLACESYLHEQFGLNVDFEAPDAVAKLLRFRLVQTDDEQKMKAVELDEALQRLDYEWDNFFQYNVENDETIIAGPRAASSSPPPSP